MKSLFLRLGALAGLFPLVWLRYVDGSVELCRVRVSSFGDFLAGRGRSTFMLGVGGEFVEPDHIAELREFFPNTNFRLPVTNWCEWERNRVHVVFPEEMQIAEDPNVTDVLRGIEEATRRKEI